MTQINAQTHVKIPNTPPPLTVPAMNDVLEHFWNKLLLTVDATKASSAPPPCGMVSGLGLS